MIIKNVLVYGEDQKFRPGEIAIEGGIFVESGRSDESQIIDGKGCYAIPGLMDIHFHGCMGSDVCDGTPEALETIAGYEASVGVTAMIPATMTLPTEELEAVLANGAAFQSDRGAELIGFNMEGPFISVAKKGAQNEAFIRPSDVAIYRRFQKAAQGMVKYIAVAPEEEGAFAFIDAVKEEVTVSLAHTNAGYDDAKEAYDRGASHAVHLFNAMPAFSHREPGTVGAARDSKQCMAELICDGIHIHPSMVRATFEMFGADRVILISDSMRAAGMPEGNYMLGGLEVEVKDNRATLASNGSLAGSVTNLFECMKTVVQKMDIPLETAVACATMNPAKSARVYDCRGSISPGKVADVVLMDENLNLQKVILRGKVLEA